MKTKTNNSTTREFAKFGGFQFSHEMELCFIRMVKVLEELLAAKIKDFPYPAGLLLANIHQNANAVLSLAPDECLPVCGLCWTELSTLLQLNWLLI